KRPGRVKGVVLRLDRERRRPCGEPRTLRKLRSPCCLCGRRIGPRCPGSTASAPFPPLYPSTTPSASAPSAFPFPDSEPPTDGTWSRAVSTLHRRFGSSSGGRDD